MIGGISSRYVPLRKQEPRAKRGNARDPRLLLSQENKFLFRQDR